MKRDLFDELLHAAYEIQKCQAKNTGCGLEQIVGEMDWVEEIGRLREEIYGSAYTVR